MRRATAVMVVVAAGLAPAVHAEWLGQDNYVGAQLDYQVKPDSKIKDAIDNGYGLDLIYGDRSKSVLPIGWEAHLFYDTSKVKDVYGGGSLSRGGVGLDGTYPFPIGHGLTPFVLGGVGFEQFKVISESKTKGFAEAGAGLLWDLPQSQNWRARADLRWVDNFTSPDLRDLWFKVGAEYSFGGHAAPKAADESVGVVPAVEKPVEAPPAAAPEPTPAPAEPAAPAKVISLKGVQFASGSDQLKPESTGVLDEAAKTLNSEYPDAQVEVAGHTDNSGDPARNKELSQRRAKAVLDYLVLQGVDAKRLSAAGYGSEQPIADNATKAGRAKNRRVELRVK